MDFFKSVFSNDPQPSDSHTSPTSSPKSQSDDQDQHSPDTKPSLIPNSNVSTITNAWTFGSSLIKTLASKSESVIDTYRRDLEEFGSGLKKETAVIREVTSRAVKDLPTSLEAGAAVAQESLESVGQAIDSLGNTVSEIISHGKESILADDSDSELSETKQISNNQQNLNSKPYSRFDAQIRAIECDVNTYCEEPEDLKEYNEWKSGFLFGEKGEEVENLIEENGVIEEIYNEIVPSKVDRETFWSRYFYRIYKVKKAEEARAELVKRAISGEEEEDLSWDVDDDDYEDSDASKLKGGSKREIEEKVPSEKKVEYSEVESEEKSFKRENVDKKVVSESISENVVDEEVHLDESGSSGNELEAKSDEKAGSEGKTDNGGSCKDSDFSVVSSQPSLQEEEDLGWDEIEDIGSNDEIKVTASGSPNRADLHKRLSAAEEEEEEDLSWDIEDDDEPVKS
uniref:Putative BSD domain-containing protein 1-like n=2 Tax=Davidia involucrata TaxID=16924 RepID=A0A5B7A4D4_DAVIN